MLAFVPVQVRTEIKYRGNSFLKRYISFTTSYFTTKKDMNWAKVFSLM